LLATPSPNATEKLSRIRHAVLDDVRELEAAYLIVRSEIDRRIADEQRTGRWDPRIKRLLLLGAHMLDARLRMRRALGHR
jgi:hypothetical protein